MTELLIIFLCLCSSGKYQPSSPELVDKVEVNYCYSEFVQEFHWLKIPVLVPCYSQIIVWEWNGEYSRYNVRDYVMDEEWIAAVPKKPETEEEIRNFRNNRWYNGLIEKPGINTLIYKDGEYYYIRFRKEGVNYYLKTKILTFTHTYSEDDSERQNKKVFEEKYRKPLRKPLPKEKPKI